MSDQPYKKTEPSPYIIRSFATNPPPPESSSPTLHAKTIHSIPSIHSELASTGWSSAAAPQQQAVYDVVSKYTTAENRSVNRHRRRQSFVPRVLKARYGDRDRDEGGYVVRYEDWRTTGINGYGKGGRSGRENFSLGEGGEGVCHANRNRERWTRRESRQCVRVWTCVLMLVSVFMLGFWMGGALTGAGWRASSPASIVGWNDDGGMLRDSDTRVGNGKWWHFRERVGWEGIGYRTWLLEDWIKVPDVLLGYLGLDREIGADGQYTTVRTTIVTTSTSTKFVGPALLWQPETLSTVGAKVSEQVSPHAGVKVHAEDVERAADHGGKPEKVAQTGRRRSRSDETLVEELWRKHNGPLRE